MFLLYLAQVCETAAPSLPLTQALTQGEGLSLLKALLLAREMVPLPKPHFQILSHNWQTGNYLQLTLKLWGL